jgi:hypothetical protein
MSDTIKSAWIASATSILIAIITIVSVINTETQEQVKLVPVNVNSVNSGNLSNSNIDITQNALSPEKIIIRTTKSKTPFLELTLLIVSVSFAIYAYKKQKIINN